MLNDLDAISKLKDDLYHGVITAAQFGTGIAPIKEKYGDMLFNFQQFHQWYYTEVLFVVTAAIMIVISFMTPPPDAKTLKYTYYGATPEEKAATKASWNADGCHFEPDSHRFHRVLLHQVLVSRNRFNGCGAIGAAAFLFSTGSASIVVQTTVGFREKTAGRWRALLYRNP